MKRRALLLALLAATGHAAQVEWKRDPDATALLRDGRLVWRFRHAPGLTKPMFDPLALSDGTALTWNAPPDHPWHHALWFSWKYLNQVNYWEEDKATGRSAGVTEWRNVNIETRPDGSARITMDLSYHAAGEPALLSERRRIEISAPGPDGRYHLDWSMTFRAMDRDVRIDRTPIPGEKDGKAFGGYAGLSIRFAKEFQEWHAETTKGPVVRDPTVAFHCETGANGIDFSGRIAGREAGIAMLDEAANLNAPTPWYTVMNRQSDFSFSEAAVVYYRPHVLKAGEALTLHYRVVAHEGRWSAAELGAAQATFAKEVKGLR